ncbi:PhzF family phenazine biosynthesis protein [Rhizorhapis suberifaciens]|uniref:Putative PhzF superfamily epimerase YddE/YHI9 n=1 Tax=Rhizorhapis suberifaciens TaxID=13656 RepID=A0A840HRE9_9SPHN|nr:PhzF family phenazine biosynthesis protein [Rhizorhapis suberifaciens]MBB4640443.1 putative PhzF superfamily epimerase YddE/YHI9 [Rhizorhapis suberifaciens]
MTQIPFTQVDAFASRAFSGNPAAVMSLDKWLPDPVLQAIAAENNLAETAFVIPAANDAEADYELRWFTPLVEVALCGHATLASGHVLIKSDAIRFRTRKAGILEVRRTAQGYELDLPAWESAPKDLPEVVTAMGSKPVETRWRDGGYSLLIYDNETKVRALRPDFTALGEMGDILFIATAPGLKTDIVSRVFAPGAGINEDPVTGSVHCLLTPYWTDRLERDNFTAYQASARGGYVDCRLAGERAILGGQCVTIIEGTFSLS